MAVARAEQPPGFSFSHDAAPGWPFADGGDQSAGLADAPRRSQRLYGRLAAVFFIGSGALVLLTLPLPVPGLNVVVLAEVGLVALAVGIAAWLAPWDRWSRQASLVLLVPAFALIALANTYGLKGIQPYGVFYIVCFVWVGMAHPPRTSVAVAPLAAIAYVLPWLHLHDNGPRVYAAVITIPLCVLVAEGIAWTGAKLERIELALQRERDRTERLRELDEAKDEFLSAVSHELRNPITICRGHIEVLEDEAGQEEIRAVKETLISEFDLMSRLVEDLTTLARVDDRAQLRMASVPLDRFVTSIAKQAEPILGQRLRIESGVPSAPLRADPQRLSQALLNLLRNAAEHARGTGPVRFGVVADHADWRFEVADEGGGLPPGDEQTVFEPFRTGSSVTGGTGLGLSIVRGIARAHGGDSGVVNRPGQGATFWVRIPR